MGEPAFIYLCRKLSEQSEKEARQHSSSEKIYTRYAHSALSHFQEKGDGADKNPRKDAMRRAENAFKEMKVISSEIKEAYQELMKSQLS